MIRVHELFHSRKAALKWLQGYREKYPATLFGTQLAGPFKSPDNQLWTVSGHRFATS